eukprot:CAMPEP_0184373116 /NCGR_PEP_ID=MMETSP1089-20130417/164317_1 /TAXON_ID=38269 ORGANISM="Gloeochaete wittrockiana, Strain SAG46.84" /NCGR_SAMPLE_ID=MMETSP1089 /ASSEMBLY_ACC=CAM_ASM_000445 /LENGTH=457 /DNA_ID=CAMNT_0026716027 /DNA_START=26 /DNA_END=1399 /DNA_ORIENTATION=+
MFRSSVEHIRSLWSNAEHSDVRLLILEKEYNLHKSILLQSPYFSAAFSERWKINEDTKKAFVLDLEDVDCSGNTVEKVLKAMHGFELNIMTFEEGLETHSLSSFLQLEEMASAAVEKSCQLVSVETAVEFFNQKFELNINTFQEGIEVHNLASFLQLEEMASAAVEKSCQLVSVETAVEFFNQNENRCLHPGLIDLEKKCRAKLLLEGYTRPDLLAQVHCLEEILQNVAFMVDGGEYKRALLIQEIIKATGTLPHKTRQNHAKRARKGLCYSSLRQSCCRLEFLTMKQFQIHFQSSRSRLEPNLGDCFWRRLCIQSVLSIPNPKAADYPDLRPYRHCIKLKKPASGTSASAEAFDAYGSSWKALSDWKEERKVMFALVRNLPSCKELNDQQNNRKFDIAFDFVYISNPRGPCHTKRSAIQLKHGEFVSITHLKNDTWNNCVDNDSVSISLLIIPHLE